MVAVTEEQLSMWWENHGGRSISVFLNTIVPVIHFFMTLSTEENNFCKHQLAARLAAALGAFIDVKVSDEQLALLLIKL
ncbi:hypothetical protein NC651_022485 [Populus alba x Populus x berolinensis]|nr:hypothetical protein NC651_022485 [Populus alba x Populus x berolinensis]